MDTIFTVLAIVGGISLFGCLFIATWVLLDLFQEKRGLKQLREYSLKESKIPKGTPDLRELPHEGEEGIQGPFIVCMKDGKTTFDVLSLDGGGQWIDDEDMFYEVHGTCVDGEFFCEFQKDIQAVFDSNGIEVEFGNKFIKGHPRYTELYGDIEDIFNDEAFKQKVPPHRRSFA